MKMQKIFLFIVLYLGSFSNMFSQRSASISPTSLTEIGDLQTVRTITVTLASEKFVRDGTLNKNSFHLVNGPTGLTILLVDVQSDSITADVDLRAPDFDTDHPNFYISIDDTVLLSGSPLNTSTCFIDGNVEKATLVPSVTLTEHNLNTAYLHIDLVNEEFLNNGNDLTISDFQLVGFPAGVQKDYIRFQDTDKDDARLFITYDPSLGEFDATIADAYVIINDDQLLYTTDTLGSSTISITGYDETVTVSSSSNLNEDNLNSGTIELTLANDDATGLDKNDLELIAFPPGTNIESASFSGDKININLSFDGTDFDVNYNSCRVRVYSSILTWNKTDDLYTTPGEIIITATVEVPGATISTVGTLEEYDLDNRIITVNLTHDSLVTPYNLLANDITLVGAPGGLGVGSVSINNSMEFEITLTHVHEDFDIDQNLGVSIDANSLNESTSDLESSNTLTIREYTEIPVATISPSAELREVYLNSRSLLLEFTEEKFIGTVNLSHVGLVNEPAGLTISSVSGQADSSITLQLSFSGPDFDLEYDDVQVSILSSVLDQTETGTLHSLPFTVYPTIEPVIGSVSIDNSSMKIGDSVELTINLSDYESGTSYVLAPTSPKIGGYDISGLQKVNNSTYTASFTVEEFGTDYPASVDIPVSNLRLDELPVVGDPYSGNISQDNDLLDANRPNVSSLYVIGQEDKKVGDNVILLISAFEEGLLPEDSTEINTVLMTEDNVVFEEIGGGTYSLIYTIEPNDQNVSVGDLQAKIYLRDVAGNVSNYYPSIAHNTLSIDASVPVIYSTTNTTPTDTVIIGGEVILTILADGSGYKLASTSEVNGVRKNEGLIFSSTDTIYTIRYPVKNFDPTVAAGELKARIILEDAVGNGSVADTVILNNDVAIFTSKPTARLTLGDEICIYDTATIYMTLSGASPWMIKYRNAVDSFYVDNILTENFSLRVNPVQTTNYIIDSVWDGTGNSNLGFGNALVIVNPLPVVNIIDLDTIYAVTDTNVVQLNGDPYGGDFFGPGVNSVAGTFTPSKAGLTGGIPHWIYYEYTDANICFNIDSQAVEIVDADVTFIWPERKVACYLDQEYILGASNTASTLGTFSIVDKSYPPGFILDNGNNTATFNPSILPWVSGQDYNEEFTIRYDYLDGKTPLFKIVDLDIEYFDTAYITTDFTIKDSCSNVEAFPLEGKRGERGVFTSSGGGVIDKGGFVYEFNPSLADTGLNKILYTYTSTYGCKQYDSVLIVNHEAPNPDFEYLNLCVPTGGGVINFQNTSDTNGLGGTVKWEWNYGDIQSGEKNEAVSYRMDSVFWHNYSRPGEREVTLTATVDETGCLRTKSIKRYLGNTPDVSIEWNTECFTSASTEFSSNAVTEDGSSVYNWLITDLAGNEVRAEQGLDLKELDHKFDKLDNYRVKMTAISDSGCVATAEEIIYLRPYVSNLTDSTPYFENFESDSNGWFAFNLENSTNSWTVSTVDPGKFPYNVSNGGEKAWYTDAVNKNTVEQSWVTSPCFDFRGMRRPMISLDRKISSDRDRDGAVLQYSYDDGDNWYNVGAVDDGSINWYNTFRINNGPGDQGEGWTGGFVFDANEPWKNSRHDLDEITGRGRVQFRIAYSSADTSAVNKEGFAFDNVWIGERSRIVLLEHFTNAGIDNIDEINRRINDLVKHNPLDVIDLQYHAEVEGSQDRMNEDNPSPGSARSLFYGTRQVPYTLIDGGLDGEMAYDFSVNNDLDTLDLFSRALEDPSFKIDFEVDEQGNKMNISIGIEALESLPTAEYLVSTVIIEKHINESAYLVPGADTAFQNVVRDMVPNAAGVSLIRQWEAGDRETIPLSWDISEFILNPEQVNIVVFIQGAENRVVYQAASNDPDLNGDPVIVSVRDVLKARDLSMLVYPNPASSHVYIAFAEPLLEKVELQLYTHTGSLARNGLLAPGTELHEWDLGDMAKGVYFLRAIQNGKIIGTHKLLIMD